MIDFSNENGPYTTNGHITSQGLKEFLSEQTSTETEQWILINEETTYFYFYNPTSHLEASVKLNDDSTYDFSIQPYTIN